MQNTYEGPDAQRLSEIDERIKGLQMHASVFGKAGRGNASIKMYDEINELNKEKARILNGTQEQYEAIDSKLAELKRLRAQCLFINFIRKSQLKKEIQNYEEQKRAIK